MISDELIASVKKHEGLRLKPYKCPAGKLTIGYGRNLEDRGINEQEAVNMLINDLYESLVVAEKLVGPTFQNLAPARKDVVAEMVFQMGEAGVARFSMMLEAIRRGMWREAAKQMLLSRWHEQTPKRCEELAEQMQTGIYAS
jgi:lysozyme